MDLIIPAFNLKMVEQIRINYSSFQCENGGTNAH